MKYGVLALATLAAAMFLQVDGAAAAKACSEVYQPVCGYVGGKWTDYSNKCFAEVAGASQIKSGKCDAQADEPMARCPLIWLPVCGKLDGVDKTFANDCIAKGAKATDIREGACKKK